MADHSRRLIQTTDTSSVTYFTVQAVLIKENIRCAEIITDFENHCFN